MRIRILPATVVTVVLGAVTTVVVAQSSDDTSGARGGAASSAAPWAEIMNSLPVGAARSAPGKPAFPDDFNGDGYRDIATRGLDGNRGELVAVIYGGPKGADPARRQVISVPGRSDVDFDWPRPLQSADFDRDGYADLLTTKPGATPTKATPTIVYGGPRGMTSRTAALPAATGDLAIGDFDGNGVPDLASITEVPEGPRSYDPKNVIVYVNPGAEPGKRILSDTERGDYEVGRSLLTGDFNGDRRTDLLLVATNKVDGVASGSWIELRLGTADGLGPAKLLPRKQTEDIESSLAAAGDINGDGRTDLVTGIDFEAAKGVLEVRLATAQGLGKARVFDAASLGKSRSPVRDAVRGGNEWLVGDVNADGRADLIRGSSWTGTISVLFGADSGLTTKGGQTFHQNTEGVPGTAQGRNRFGEELSLTDTDHDGEVELVVSAQGEDDNDGSLYLFATTANGLTTKGIKRIGAAALGIGGKKPELGGNLLD